MPARIRLSALVRAFLLAMEVENLRGATLGWYDWRLARLVRWTGDPAARALTSDDLRRWLLAMRAGEQGRTTADSYVDGHRRAASALLNWAVREGHLPSSPLARIRPIRVEIRELPTLSADEVARLIETQPSRRFEGARNRAILALLYDTGIRVGELVALRPATSTSKRGRSGSAARPGAIGACRSRPSSRASSPPTSGRRRSASASSSRPPERRLARGR